MKKILFALVVVIGAKAQTICNAAIISQGSPVGLVCPVDATTGTTQYSYVKWDSGGVGVTLGGTGDTSQNFFGIADQTVAAGTNTVLIHTLGPAFATFDGATTAGDAFTTSTTSSGALHDTGVAFNSRSCPTGALGIINKTLGSSGNAPVIIQPCIGAGTIASGTAALGTSAISSLACATVVTVSATGVASTDSISWSPNASIKAVTGYAPATAGGLSIAAYPTANNVNFDVCNWSTGSITPGSVTLNWRVVR